MAIFQRLLNTKSNRQAKAVVPLTRNYKRLAIEQLEARITPADVVVSSLLFRGDLIADGASFTAINKQIQIGFNPVQGEEFRSLVTLTGDTVLDPALQNFQFKGTGAVPGVAGLQDFWSSTTLSTFDVQKMTATTGESITGKALTLGDLVSTATTLTLENPNGGDTSDSQVKLDGAGTLAFTGASTPLALNPLAVTVTGAGTGTASGKASGNFQTQGTNWTLTENPFAATFTGGQSVVTVTGTASAQLRTDTVSMQMDTAKDAANGLVLEAGAIKTLGASATAQAFTIAGTPVTLDGQFSLTNTALDFKGKAQHTGALSFLDYSDFRFSMENSKLTGLTAYATNPWLNLGTAVAGVAFSLVPFKGVVSLTANMESKLTSDPSGKESLSITGSAGFTWDKLSDGKSASRNAVAFTVTAAGNGWVIKDGVVQDWDIQLDGRLDFQVITLEARATRLWYTTNDPTYGKDTIGFSGSVYLNVGNRTFKKDDKTIASEPANVLELNCGTRQSPGIVFANGEPRRVDVAFSVKEIKSGTPEKGKNGSLDFGGMKWRLTQGGFYYDANSGTTEKTFGLYGTIATDFGLSGKTSSGAKSSFGLASASLGTRANPGLQVNCTKDPASQTWVNNFDLRDVTLRWTDFRLAGVGFNHVELSYKVPDKNKPNEAFWSGKLEVAIKDLYFGGSFKLKRVTDEATGITSTFFDGATLSLGVDPTGSSNGYLIASPLPVFLVRLEVGVENWTDPASWAFFGTAVIGFGNRLPYLDSTNIDPFTNIIKPRMVYPTVVRGTVRFYPASGKVTGTVDVFVAAYWDKMANSSFAEGWKALGGSGKGSFTIDVANNNYRVDFTGNLFQLVNGTFQLVLKNGEFLLYANIQLKPTPYGIFDFWPVNGIDVSGTTLLLLTQRQKLFAAWAQVKIVGINQTLGLGYDFLKGETIWVTSGNKVKELIQMKNAFLDEIADYKYIQSYQAKADQGATALQSSRYTVSIPFVTADVGINGITYAKALTAAGIQVTIPTTSGNGVNALPPGTSYTTRVEIGQPNGKYTTGSIIVDIFPNSTKKTDFNKSFASLGIDKLMVDIKVGLKQNSLFFLPGQNEIDYKPYVDTILADPAAYLNYIDHSQAGSAQFANAVWDTSRQVPVNGKNYPLSPAQFENFTVKGPLIGVSYNNLVASEVNPFTNTTTFVFITNGSKQTKENGNVSLLIAEEADIASNRWTVQRTGEWSTDVGGNSGFSYSADAWVVEKNVFDEFDSKNQKVETPFAGTIGTEVLFFNSEKVAQTGVVQAVGTSVTILSGGITLTVAPDQVKALWARKAQVKLLSKTNSGATEDVFTATLIPTGFAQKQETQPQANNYYEAFSADEAVTLGQMPALHVGPVAATMLKLPTLPSYVTGKEADEGSANGSRYFPVDASAKLTTLRQGTAPFQANTDGTLKDATASFILNDVPWDVEGNGATVTWSEKGMSPTPKVAYLQIDDNINPPAFSGFYRFTPSVQLAGKALVTDNISPARPYAGLTVYLDTNNNGKFDAPEAFNDANSNGVFDADESFNDANNNGVRDTLNEPNTLTNSAGEYYFFDVAAGSHQIGFDLPENRLPDSGSTIVTVTRGSEAVTTVADFYAKYSNPTLTGQLFVDTNQNNKLDLGERGVSAAKLLVTDKDGKAVYGSNGQLLTAVTDDEGNYSITLWEEYGTEVKLKLEGTAQGGETTIKATKDGGDSKLFTGIDYAKPVAFTHDFALQATYEFKLDSNASTFENVFSYLMLFLEGKYTGVNFRTSGFEFLVDRFKMLPFEENEQGVENAKGKAIFGGQTLNFEFVGPRGLVANGLKLLEVNLKLSGDFNIFGAKLNLDNLTGKYVAGDASKGTSDSFQLTGATTLDIGGNKVTAELLNSGLVLSDRGIESLDLKFTGALRIAGQDVDLGSLKAVYDRVADKLTLSGDTKLLTLGSETDGTFFRLKGALIEITGGKVTTLQATVEGAMDIAGAKFTLDSLTFAYLVSANTFRLTGSSTVDFSGDKFTVSLPEPGAEFSDAGTRIKGKVTGSANLGSKASPVTLSLDNLDLDYTDNSLRIAGKTSVTVNKTQVGLAEGDLRFKDGQFQSLTANANGEFIVGGAVVTLGTGNRFEYKRADDLLRLAGDAMVSLAPAAGATGENAKNKKLVGVSGSITLKDGEVSAIAATVSTGSLAIAGVPLQIQSMGFAYDGAVNRYAISGSASLELLGGKLTASFPSPGIVWKDGQFDSLSFKLSGELPLQKDKAGKAAIALKVEDLAAVYSDTQGSLTLSGGASVRAGSLFGKLETDATGIVIVNNELRNFSAFLTLNLGFGGEAYTDTNQNLVWDKGEPFTDANANTKYDAGLSLDFTKAGISYAAATQDKGQRLLITGKGVLDFDGAGSGKEGVTVDLTSPGIELVDGEVENFSAAITAAFDLKSLNFKPSGAAGLRYQRAKAQLDLFGGMNIKVGTNEFGFALGTSFDNPGIRLENGAITYASAALTSSFGVGALKFESAGAGFTYDGAKDTWAIYGGVKLTNVFSVGLSLGTQKAPGLLIRDNDWEIKNLTLSLENLSLGSFGINEAKLTINRSDTSWSVYAKCAVQLPIAGGVGASGEFSLVNGNIDLISVTLASQTGINIPNTPLFINYISGSIKNLTNLDQIIISGSMGIGVGSQVDILGKKATIAQFVGSFTLDPNSLRLQVDAYLGAINSGTLTAPKWNGVLGQGTGTIYLDWGKGEYYADVKVSLLGGVFEAGGRLSFSDANGLVMRAYAALKVPDEVWVIGGTKLATADFLLVANPAQNQMFVMGWGTFSFWTCGIKVDFSKPSVNFDLLKETDINRELKNANVQPTAFATMAVMDTPVLRSASVLASPMGPRLMSGFNAQSNQAWEYRGQSQPVPMTEVTSGLYQARFRVKDPARWSDSANWLNQVTFLAEPVPGVEFEALPPDFDPATGYGTIGLRAMPLTGQYLPRGLSVRSKLRSPVEFRGIYPETSQGDPDLETAWEQAFAYQGTTPGIGSDQDGSAGPENLAVAQAIYTITFRPNVQSGQEDWKESLRLYLNPVDGVRFQVGEAEFNPVTGTGSLTFVAKPTNGRYLPLGTSFTGVLRSKVELTDPEAGEAGTYPDISCVWKTDLPTIDTPINPGSIHAGLQMTRLSGRVNDPRLKEVQVSLAYATSQKGETRYFVPLADGSGSAESILVPVNSDGTWSTDIRWDSSDLPEVRLWLFGAVSRGGMDTPVRSMAAGPFGVVRDIEGTLRDTQGGYAGVPVFADLNKDGVWQQNEPRSITDQNGHYGLNVPNHSGQVVVVYAVPRAFTPSDGSLARRVVDLSRGPVTVDFSMRPTQNLLRGSIFVTGDLFVDGGKDSLRQPVSGLGVVLTGADGRVLRVTTNNLGQYEVPVEELGDYTLSLDFAGSTFLGNSLREMPGIPTGRIIRFSTFENTIINMEPIRVDSVGVVRTTESENQGSLDELVRQANTGFVSTIEFDGSLRGATIDVALPEETPVANYYAWNPNLKMWLLVQHGASEESQFGPTAFLLQEDIRILGADLGITLRAAQPTADSGEEFRAFHVMPGVEALIEGLTLQGFSANGTDGEGGESGEAVRSAGGGGAGLGGAILNRGKLNLNRVHFVGNSALGGDGGPGWNGFVSDTELNGAGGSPFGTSGSAINGGMGGGYLGGKGGKTIPVTLTYTLGDDPTEYTVTGRVAAGGGGGSGLGGAIYNASGSMLTIDSGTIFTGNTAAGGKGGVGSPEFFTNLANAFFGDNARTVRVTGFEAWEETLGMDGSGLGGAIFNDGGTVSIVDSLFRENSTTDAGAALYSLRGGTVINTSAFTGNSSGADQGVRFEGGSLVQGSLEINRSFILGDAEGPKALVAEGGRRLGQGNIISSQTGFAWGVQANSVVPRPKSPVTGEPYVPEGGALVDYGAPVTQSTTPWLAAGVYQPIEVGTSLANPAGMTRPSGRVILAYNGLQMGTGQLHTDGSVSIAAPGMKAGKYIFEVYYEGDSLFAGNLGQTIVMVGTTSERAVEELYETYLGRVSDTDGLKAWSIAIDNGIPLSQVVHAFKASTEASHRVVESVYQDLLGRLPEHVGLENWTRFLQTGKTERDMRAVVLGSAEYQSVHSHEETIQALYVAFLNRQGDDAGTANWLRHWETGTSLPAIIQAIENSKESREYLVDELYSGILGRKADDTGLHFWVNALEKGLSENSLEAALLASVEFKT